MAEKTTTKKSSSKSSKTVTLKRNVTIKVIVTEKFKQFLVFELEQGIKSINARIGAMEEQLKQLEKSGNAGFQVDQFNAEKSRMAASVEDMTQRINQAKQLELNSYFIQGNVEGFVGVNVGDNLYEKLGAMEIIVKDGVIQSVNPIGSFDVAGIS